MTNQEIESKWWHRVLKRIWIGIILGVLFVFLDILDFRTAIFIAIILAISVIIFIFYIKLLRRIVKRYKNKINP